MTEVNEVVATIKNDSDFTSYVSFLTERNVTEIILYRTKLITKYGLENVQKALVNYFEGTCLSLSGEDSQIIQDDDDSDQIQNIIEELELIQAPDEVVSRIIETCNSQEKKFAIKLK